MKLDGVGIFVNDLETMVHFYKTVLEFDIGWEKGESNVFLEKDGILFLMYGRKDLEKMTNRKYDYIKGINGHFEIASSVPTFKDVDIEFTRIVNMGATPILEPETEPLGQRTCYIADPEGNLVEIGSFNN